MGKDITYFKDEVEDEFKKYAVVANPRSIFITDKKERKLRKAKSKAVAEFLQDYKQSFEAVDLGVSWQNMRSERSLLRNIFSDMSDSEKREIQAYNIRVIDAFTLQAGATEYTEEQKKLQHDVIKERIDWCIQTLQNYSYDIDVTASVDSLKQQYRNLQEVNRLVGETSNWTGKNSKKYNLSDEEVHALNEITEQQTSAWAFTEMFTIMAGPYFEFINLAAQDDYNFSNISIKVNEASNTENDFLEEYSDLNGFSKVCDCMGSIQEIIESENAYKIMNNNLGGKITDLTDSKNSLTIDNPDRLRQKVVELLDSGHPFIVEKDGKIQAYKYRRDRHLYAVPMDELERYGIDTNKVIPIENELYANKPLYTYLKSIMNNTEGLQKAKLLQGMLALRDKSARKIDKDIIDAVYQEELDKHPNLFEAYPIDRENSKPCESELTSYFEGNPPTLKTENNEDGLYSEAEFSEILQTMRPFKKHVYDLYKDNKKYPIKHAYFWINKEKHPAEAAYTYVDYGVDVLKTECELLDEKWKVITKKLSNNKDIIDENTTLNGRTFFEYIMDSVKKEDLGFSLLSGESGKMTEINELTMGYTYSKFNTALDNAVAVFRGSTDIVAKRFSKIERLIESAGYDLEDFGVDEKGAIVTKQRAQAKTKVQTQEAQSEVKAQEAQPEIKAQPQATTTQPVINVNDKASNAKREYFSRYTTFVGNNNAIRDAINSNDVKTLTKLANDNPAETELQDYITHRINKLNTINDMLANTQVHHPIMQQRIDEATGSIFIDSTQASQQSTYNGCWSVSLAEQLQYRGVSIDQETIRAYRPHDVNSYAYANKDIGNAISDYAELIHKLLPNTAVNNIACMTANKGLVQKVMQLALTSALVNSNSPVSFNCNGHYRTIIGVDNSTGSTMISMHDPLSSAVTTISYNALINQCYDNNTGNYTFEAQWLTDMIPQANNQVNLSKNVTIQYNQDGEIQHKDYVKGMDRIEVFTDSVTDNNETFEVHTSIPTKLAKEIVLQQDAPANEDDIALKFTNDIFADIAERNKPLEDVAQEPQPEVVAEPKPEQQEIKESQAANSFDGFEIIDNDYINVAIDQDAFDIHDSGTKDYEKTLKNLQDRASKSATFGNNAKIAAADDKFSYGELQTYLSSVCSFGNKGCINKYLNSLKPAKNNKLTEKLIQDTKYVKDDFKDKLSKSSDNAQKLPMLNRAGLGIISNDCSAFLKQLGYENSEMNYSLRKIAKTVDIALITTLPSPVVQDQKSINADVKRVLANSVARMNDIFKGTEKKSSSPEFAELRDSLSKVQQKLTNKEDAQQLTIDDIQHLQTAALNYMNAKGSPKRSTNSGQLRYDAARDIHDICWSVTKKRCTQKELEALRDKIKNAAKKDKTKEASQQQRQL